VPRLVHDAPLPSSGDSCGGCQASPEGVAGVGSGLEPQHARVLLYNEGNGKAGQPCSNLAVSWLEVAGIEATAPFRIEAGLSSLTAL
jgi:hypothetical protein